MIRDHDQAKAIAQLGHAVFRRLGELDVPTFAFVNGAAMGGGVEVALHCTYRTISAGVPGRGPARGASSAWSPAGVAPSCCPG